MVRVITIAREHGSGGREVARLVAEKLGWKLVDRVLIEEVARLAKVPPEDAERYDEAPNSWIGRIAKSLWAGSAEGFAGPPQGDLFDADAMARLTRAAVLEAASGGACVIVGRAGQCVLRGRRDVLNVFVYAPLDSRLGRVRNMYRDRDEALEAVNEIDRVRASYVHYYYGCHWDQRELYDVIVNTDLGIDAAAEIVLCAAHAGGDA